MLNNNLTIVTSLFDIGRDKINPGFAREFDHYLECFSKMLQIDLPMVIFCDSDVEEFVFKHRSRDNTRVVNKTTQNLKDFPFYDQIQRIRTDPNWFNMSGWMPDSPQAALELYNPLVMSKQFLLNDASIYNYFDTKYFLWLDAGISNTVNVNGYFTEETVAKLLRDMDKMLYIAFPYDGTAEVHGFEKTAMDRYAGTKTEYVVRGGMFGGTRTSIENINNIYYNLLMQTLNSGLMGTEESIFTIISYLHKNLISLQMIESNGLIYKYFEDLRERKYNDVVDGDGSLAIYVLTYNFPEQFELWVNSFKAANPEVFNSCKKYVFNNSDDPKVKKAYKKIIDDNGLIEYAYDNIGINDGRFEVAKHFDASTHQYMVFFEDDMLLNSRHGGESKFGLGTYYDKIFDTAIDILKFENLDFIKLSFDEVYGNNSDNWGWYNVPQDKKDLYFPDGNKKTKIFHIDSLRGVPYAVGEFHYCNWPILFNKIGNRKVFLETEYAHKYEQTWMSMVCSLQKDGKLRAGSLLGTVITHNRIKYYPKEKRRENRHYK